MKKILYVLLILFILFQLKITFGFYSTSPCPSQILPMPNCGRGWSLQKYLFDANYYLILLPIQNFFNQIIILIGDIMLKFQR